MSCLQPRGKNYLYGLNITGYNQVSWTLRIGTEETQAVYQGKVSLSGSNMGKYNWA